MGEPLAILHLDEHFLVVCKPAGLLSVPAPDSRGRTLSQVLAEQGLDATPVHRLDRDVSGCVLCARDESTRGLLEQLFRERELEKLYWAMVLGHPRPASGEIKFPIKEERDHARVSAVGKPSLTRYRTLRSFAAASELEVELVTGRYNQIRVHFAHAGWPLVGERKYACGKDDPFKARRVALHAWRLAFAHPHGGKRLEVEAPLPGDLRVLLERAGGG